MVEFGFSDICRYLRGQSSRHDLVPRKIGGYWTAVFRVPPENLEKPFAQLIVRPSLGKEVFESTGEKRIDAGPAGYLKKPRSQFLLIHNWPDRRLRRSADRFDLIVRIVDSPDINFGGLREKSDL